MAHQGLGLLAGKLEIGVHVGVNDPTTEDKSPEKRLLARHNKTKNLNTRIDDSVKDLDGKPSRKPFHCEGAVHRVDFDRSEFGCLGSKSTLIETINDVHPMGTSQFVTNANDHWFIARRFTLSFHLFMDKHWRNFCS